MATPNGNGTNGHVGKVVQIIGPVVDVEFSEKYLPPIYQALRITSDGFEVPDPIDVKIEKDFPMDLDVVGEKRYTSLIVQNLLENARKYNHPGGRIRVRARKNADYVLLIIGNTGRPIPPDAQPHIFERFRRDGTVSGISGHGLGLNLARELARLHGGNIRLACSENDWTEFEVSFPVAQPAPD